VLVQGRQSSEDKGMQKKQVRTGIDQLASEQFSFLKGRRVGLLTHAPACDSQLRPTLGLFRKALGDDLKVVFTPEHGFHAHAQDLEPVAIQAQPALPEFVSLYGNDVSSLFPSTSDLGKIDVLVIDLVDVGSRYYTFQASMLYCMKVAFSQNLPVVVLDRPNPMGCKTVEGPMLLEGWESFVGVYPIPTRHGMTIAELAILYKEELELLGNLEIIPCEGYTRNLLQDQTTVPWVMPSPNMPSLETAIVYPGQCLLEGTNLSEGRGTTRPFELFGAPWLDADQTANTLNALGLPGVQFRPVNFRPTFQKWHGQICGGAQLHVYDRELYRPVRSGLAILQQLRNQDPSRFAWRTETYEFVSDRLAIDLLFGSDRERLALEQHIPWHEITREWEEEENDFLAMRQPYLIYGD
jgi:uncharacterized protein YbbC (DUF1343 family)